MNYATVKDLSRQQVGQIVYTPMVNEHGKVAIEGLTLKLAEDEYLFTQSAGLKWLEVLREKSGLTAVALQDVTPDYTCYALQGPRSTAVLEALTKDTWRDLRFSRCRRTQILDTETIVARQGVTGELGYEFLMRTDTGRAHELWRKLREVGRELGLRELGLKAQMIGHTETGIATAIRDYLPARGTPEQLRRMMRYWMSPEELERIDYPIEEHFCSPAELGWGYTINLDKETFYGRDALLRERDKGGPARRLVGLEWSSEDLVELYAAQFRDAAAPPPPDLPTGQFRVFFLKVLEGGWASGWAYSPTLRRMISLARVGRETASGTKVQVEWGGFSDEPRMNIRATVVELPFIARKRENTL
jgi:glycine cleavage system aminomethyltransferase T